MPLADTDIVVYAAANKPTDDSSTNGGAIDTSERVGFTQLPQNSALEVVSDDAEDNADIEVFARAPSGAIVSETVSLNGTTPVALSNLGTVERFLRAVLDEPASGNVTLRVASDGGDIAVIPAGELAVRRLFIDAESDPDSPKTYYEKVFIANVNGEGLALLNATIAESADPTGKCAFGLEGAVNGNGTSANRLTAPAGITIDGDPKAVPGTNLAAGDAIGVWVSLALDAGEQPIKSTYTLQASGSST